MWGIDGRARQRRVVNSYFSFRKISFTTVSSLGVTDGRLLILSRNIVCSCRVRIDQETPGWRGVKPHFASPAVSPTGKAVTTELLIASLCGRNVKTFVQRTVELLKQHMRVEVGETLHVSGCFAELVA